MSAPRFTRSAEADLIEVGDYTIRTWGATQAGRYLTALETICKRLAHNPELGRRCDDIRPGLRRMEHAKHVIFYRLQKSGVLIVRILHLSMLPGRHEMEDENEN